MSTDDSQALTLLSDDSKPPEHEYIASKFPEVLVDRDGDLCLVVGDKEGSTFIVCSKTVARACPVWKKLLYGQFSESQQPSKDSGEKWTVRLPDDNPGSMKILLNIIHSRFDQVPINAGAYLFFSIDGTWINYNDLFLLTVLTDKYDLARNLRPWAPKWLKDIKFLGGLARATATDTDRLFWIAWELGDQELFTNAIKESVLSFVKKGGKIRKQLDSPELFSLGYEPANTLSLVDGYREKIIEKLLQPVKDAVGKLLQPDGNDTNSLCTLRTIVKRRSETLDCETTMLGATIRSLHASQLWPIPKSTNVQVSVTALAEKLRCLDSKSRLPDHYCQALLNIKATIDTILSDAVPPLPEAYISHLKAQAEKTGVI